MTNHELDIRTSTIQDIDNYVNTLTETITSTVDDKVKSKTLKPNSVGLPQEIRDLIKEKRRQRRYWQQTRQQHYKTNYNRLDKTIKQYIRQTRQNSWTNYCNDAELAEGHNDA
jgi:predicted RNA-binding protein with RPS1 domain